MSCTLQVVGLPAGSVRSFVLDNDPVPRAMVSVDPTLALIRGSAPVAWLLEARRRLLGDGAALTPERFLYENVGEVYLIRWSPESGQQAGAPPRHTALHAARAGLRTAAAFQSPLGSGYGLTTDTIVHT